MAKQTTSRLSLKNPLATPRGIALLVSLLKWNSSAVWRDSNVYWFMICRMGALGQELGLGFCEFPSSKPKKGWLFLTGGIPIVGLPGRPLLASRPFCPPGEGESGLGGKWRVGTHLLVVPLPCVRGPVLAGVGAFPYQDLGQLFVFIQRRSVWCQVADYQLNDSVGSWHRGGRHGDGQKNRVKAHLKMLPRHRLNG